LPDVARQAAGVRKDFEDGLHLGALQGEPARHDHADVARAEDDDFLAHHRVVQIDVGLCDSGGPDARRPVSRNADGAPGALAAAHGQHDGPCPELQDAGPGGRGHEPIPRDADDRSFREVRYSHFFHKVDEALRVFRPAQAFPEPGQAESVMYALAQDAAQVLFALQDQDVRDTQRAQFDRCGEAGRAASYDDDVFIFHWITPAPFR